jgi:hypothetical protein
MLVTFGLSLAAVGFALGAAWAGGNESRSEGVSDAEATVPVLAPGSAQAGTPSGVVATPDSTAPSSPSGLHEKNPYTYTFDGAPVSPESAYWMPGFDIQVHTREMQSSPGSVQFMEAGHGSACDAPPATHSISMAEATVFRCKDHVMTALRADDYGVIYLTPDRMLDWSDGEATLSVNASTLKTSTRDWWDLWLSDWDSNLALPLGDDLPDLQQRGEANAVEGDYLHIRQDFAEPRFVGSRDGGILHQWSLEPYTAQSETQRDSFVLTVRASTFDFCKPDEGLCWFLNEPHELNVTRAVVQIGHHSYNPRKDAAGVENTWHWDNLSLSDSVPFTMLRANERYAIGEGSFSFDYEAPSGAFLRFSAVGSVRINGELVPPQVPTEHPEHFNSYFVPIPPGTSSINYVGGPDQWWDSMPMMKDVAIWAQVSDDASVPSNIPIPPTEYKLVVPGVVAGSTYRRGSHYLTTRRSTCDWS